MHTKETQWGGGVDWPIIHWKKRNTMEEYITFINWVLYLFIECKDSIDLNEKNYGGTQYNLWIEFFI